MHRLEARDDDGIGRVVDDDVDAGRGLERPDVTALAADDAPLHFVGREDHRRHARFRGLLRGNPLDRERDDLLRFAVGVLPGLLGDVAHERGRFVPGRAFETGDQLALGLLRRQARHLLEPGADVLLALAEGAGALLEPLIELAQLLLSGVDAGEFLVEAFVEVFADRHELFFGRQHETLALVGRPALDAPSPHVEDQCRDEDAAEHGRDDTEQLCHGSISTSPPFPAFVFENKSWPGGEDRCQPAVNAFRFAGGSIFARSSATAARRAATSRSVCFA